MNLTVAAWWSREAIKYTIAFIIFLLLARILWIVGAGIYRHFFPPAPPPPTVLFGKLPLLTFPISSKPDQTFNFSLELPEQELPKTSTILPLFATQARRPYFGALEQTRKTAKALGFGEREESLSPSIYRFRKKEVEGISLDINIITGVFAISSNLSQNQDLLNLRPPSGEVTTSIVRAYLSSADLFPADFSQGKASTQFLQNQAGNLIQAPSLSEANLVRVDLFRQSYNDLPTVTPMPGKATVWFILSGEERDRQIIAGEYHYFGVDQQTSSTYPIKTANQAWEELKNNQGAFIFLPGQTNIVVRRVYLAYYDSPEFQEFFQPVFVFEGDNGFVGYVPAVTSEYYGK